MTGDIGKTFSGLKNLAVLQGFGTKNPNELGWYRQSPLTTGREVVSLDIVSKFEPTILCDIRSWDYAAFPGHFDMVWTSPVCTEYSRALTTRPRRLLEGDALVLSALEIIAHFDPHVDCREPGHGLLKTRPFMERLPWVDVTCCKYGTPYRKQTRLWTNMRGRPRRSLCRPGSRCEAWQDGRHLRAAQRGPRLMEGQYERGSQRPWRSLRSG